MSSPPSTIDREMATSIIAVLTHLKQRETNTNRNDMLSTVIARVWEFYDGSRFDVSTDTITPSDVELTYAFLEEHGPTRSEAQTYRDEHGNPHPNRPLNHGLEFVDTASRYRTGCLPSFRSWTTKYIHDGVVIAERTYDYEDSIRLTLVVDSVRYKATATERAADGTVHVTVLERPYRDDIDVYIHRRADQTVKIETHNGPNVANDTHPVRTLEAAFDSERTEETGVIVDEPFEDVVEFAEGQGWEYEADDAQLLLDTNR